MIKEFNRQNLAPEGLVRQEIKIALDAVAKKLGIESLSLGNITFLANSFHGKLEARLVKREQDPDFIAKMRRSILIYGLPSDTIGRQFVNLGQTFQVDRIDTKKPKFPIIAHDINTKRGYKFTVDQVKRAFEKHGA